MKPDLEEYMATHSTPEDPVLEELYRQTHIKFVNPNMVSGHLQGMFLKFISLMAKPKYILEIGTFTGYSAICLAAGLPEDGKLYTIEINDELQEFSQKFFKKSGLSNKIEQLTGNAIEIIPGIDKKFDLVYIDGDKREYIDYFLAAFPKLNPGGFIIADNILWGDKVLDPETNDQQTLGIIAFNEMIRERNDIEKVVLPIRDGITLIRKSTI